MRLAHGLCRRHGCRPSRLRETAASWWEAWPSFASLAMPRLSSCCAAAPPPGRPCSLTECYWAAQRLHVAPMSRHQTGSKDSLHMQIPLVTHVCAFPFLRPVCARRPAEVFESPQLRSDCCCHCLSAVFPCRDCFTRFNTQVTVTLSCCSVEKASSGRTWLSRRSREAAKLEWRYWSWPYAERTFQISAPTKVVVRYWA